METKLHKDAKLIDRIGRKAVLDHFKISRQTIWVWRTTGIPERYRASFALLKERT